MPGDVETRELRTADGRRPRILVVDADVASAGVTRLLVEQFGCAALRADSGESALASLRAGPPIDLVLLDLALPDMDGIVLALLIRSMGEPGDLPIVPLVRNRADLIAPRSRAAGFSGGILRPYSPRELYAVLQLALDRSRHPAGLRNA